MSIRQQKRRRFLTKIGALSLTMSLTNFSIATATEAGLLDDPLVPVEAVSDSPVIQTEMRVDQELLRRAEANYQSGRFDVAREQFGLVAAMNNHPFAWLRIGNIWHRLGRSSMAIDAYSRAQRSAGAIDGHQGIAQRAQKNLALLGLALTDRSLRAVGAGAAGSAGDRWTNEVRRRLVQLEASLRDPLGVTAERVGSTPGQENIRHERARTNLSAKIPRAAPRSRTGAGS